MELFPRLAYFWPITLWVNFFDFLSTNLNSAYDTEFIGTQTEIFKKNLYVLFKLFLNFQAKYSQNG